MKTIFVTGIGTEVGKTVVASIITQSLQADYWKPIQAGELDNTDTDKVENWIDNYKTILHKSSYRLKEPMSPHAAAKCENISIYLQNIIKPKTQNHLVIEGAGGILVPINDKNTILDLINTNDNIVVVCRNYLGSINHSLMTIQILQSKGFKNIGIIFNGVKNDDTESIIIQKTNAFLIGRINEEQTINKEIVNQYAKILHIKLHEFLAL